MLDYKGNFYTDSNGKHFVNQLDINSIEMGNITIDSNHVSAGKVSISSNPTPKTLMVTVLRGGVVMSDVKIVSDSNGVTVQTNSTSFVLTAGDVIYYLVA